MKFSLVVACTLENGIGKENKLPWKLSKDMNYFKTLTSSPSPLTGKRPAVIMGRKTWESIPISFRPLKDRLNVVLSRQTKLEFPDNVLHFSNLSDALAGIESETDQVYIIGGAQVYAQAITHPYCDAIYLTRIFKQFDCDTFFDPLPPTFSLVKSERQTEGNIEFEFQVYKKQ